MDFGNIDWGQIARGLSTPAMNPLDQIQRRWPTPGMTAETMPTMPNAGFTPEVMAKTLASRGIPPPAQDLQPLGASLTGGGTGLPGDTPYRMPDEGAVDKWRAGV